jgi:hypothetical protein
LMSFFICCGGLWTTMLSHFLLMGQNKGIG